MTRKTTAKKTKSSPTTKKSPAPIPDLPKNPFLFEILNLVNKERSAARKVQVLQKFAYPALKTIFIWNFDETVISVLPEGDVPYAALDKESGFNGTLSEKIQDAVKKMEELDTISLGENDQGRSTIRKEARKFYNFVKGGNDALSSIRRETMFINILSGLHPLEAEILVLTKDKKLDTKYKLTKDIVAQAYPDIRWGNRS